VEYMSPEGRWVHSLLSELSPRSCCLFPQQLFLLPRAELTSDFKQHEYRHPGLCVWDQGRCYIRIKHGHDCCSRNRQTEQRYDDGSRSIWIEFHHDYGGTGMTFHHFCTPMVMVMLNSDVLLSESWRCLVYMFPLAQSWIRGDT
jgi:hypothetical protein